MKNRALMIGFIACWVAAPPVAGAPLADDTARINYAIGYQIGGDLKRQEVAIDSDALVQGVTHALAGTEALMSAEELRTTLVDLKKRILAEEQQRRQAAQEKHRAEGRAFLEVYAARNGVNTLPSGLKYRVLKAGDGPSAAGAQQVTVHYRGLLPDGAEFDTTQRAGEPRTLQIEQLIPGFREALPLMRQGALWELVLPPELAYGERGPLAHRTLIYEMELISAQ